MAKKKDAAAAPILEVASPFTAPEPTVPVPVLIGQAPDPHVIVVDGWDKIVIPMNGVRIETIPDATMGWVTNEDDYARAITLVSDLERVIPFVSDAHDLNDLNELTIGLKAEIETWNEYHPEVIDAT